MNIEWSTVSAIVAVVGSAAAVVIYIIRQETRAVKDLVVLDRETVKIRLSAVERELTKMAEVLTLFAEYKTQLAVFEQRQMSQGGRLDDLTQRFNDYSDYWHNRRYAKGDKDTSGREG